MIKFTQDFDFSKYKIEKVITMPHVVKSILMHESFSIVKPDGSFQYGSIGDYVIITKYGQIICVSSNDFESLYVGIK